MKKTTLLLIALSLAVAIPSRAQLITGFGTSELNPVNIQSSLAAPIGDFQTPWTNLDATQTATTLTVTNEPALGGGGIVSTLTTPITLSDPSNNYASEVLLLTGEITGTTPPNSFAITLYDTSGDFNSLSYSFNWGSWSNGLVDAVASTLPVEQGAFNGTVGTWGISVNGASTDTISFQFDSLTAVPEPSTYAMFGVGALALWVLRRRKTLLS